MRCGKVIAAQGVFVGCAHVARADAVGFKAAQRAGRQIAVGDAGDIAAVTGERPTLKACPQGGIAIHHFGFGQSPHRGLQHFHIAAQARHIIANLEHNPTLRAQARIAVIPCVGKAH